MFKFPFGIVTRSLLAGWRMWTNIFRWYSSYMNTERTVPLKRAQRILSQWPRVDDKARPYIFSALLFKNPFIPRNATANPGEFVSVGLPAWRVNLVLNFKIALPFKSVLSVSPHQSSMKPTARLSIDGGPDAVLYFAWVK